MNDPLLISEETPIKKSKHKHKRKEVVDPAQLSRQQKKRARYDPLEARTVTQMQEQLQVKAGG